MSKFGAKWCLTFLVAQIIEIKFTQSGTGTESKPLLYTVHNYEFEFEHIFVILYLCYLCKSMNLGSMAGPEQLPKWDLPSQRSHHPKLCSWIGHNWPLGRWANSIHRFHSGRRRWEVSWIFYCNMCFLRSPYWWNLELLQVAGNPRESTAIRKLNHGSTCRRATSVPRASVAEGFAALLGTEEVTLPCIWGRALLNIGR